MSMLFGLLGSIGEVAGSTAVEATGSEFLGDVATQVANSVVGQAVDSAVSTVVDTVFGPDAYENKKKMVYNSIEDAKALGLFTGDISNEASVLQAIKDSNTSHSDLHVAVHNFAKDFAEGVALQGLDLAVPIERNSGLGELMTKLSQSNPVYYYLVNKLLDKTGDLVIPDDPEYNAVASVYNGNGIYGQFTKSVFDGKNTVFSLKDEKGGEKQWKYPEYNTYTVVSPLWGTWVGINSPNNSVPLRGLVDNKIQESYLDQIAMLHDIDYHDLGSFSLLADQKLISRAAAGKANGWFKFDGEEVVANIAINYFSTLGAVMRKMLGPVVNDLYSDVYGVEVPNEVFDSFDERPVENDLQYILDSIDIEYD